jgi:hypothetical protein
MPAQWVMACLQWAAGDSMCHLPRRPDGVTGKRSKKANKQHDSGSAASSASASAAASDARRFLCVTHLLSGG